MKILEMYLKAIHLNYFENLTPPQTVLIITAKQKFEEHLLEAASLKGFYHFNGQRIFVF